MKDKTIAKCIIFWFAVLAVMLLLSFVPFSCKSMKEETNSTRKDSIHTAVNYKRKDTIITVPGQTLKLSVPFLQLGNAPATTKTERGSLTVSKDGDNIIAECNIDDYKATISILEKTITVFKETVITQQTTIEKQQSIIDRLGNILMWVGGAAILFFGFSVYFSFKRKPASNGIHQEQL